MSLADDTIKDIRATFQPRGHNISPAMWMGVGDVVEALEKAARGKLEPLAYLSSLDPGVGKTTTATCFVRNLIKSPAHRDTGVMFCVARLQEIENLIRDMALDKRDVGILITDDKANAHILAKGSGDNDNARVLFTTHAMVESRLGKLKAGQTFADLKEFHYRGKARTIKIWDESMLPAQELTLSASDLSSLAKPCDRKFPQITRDVIKWAGTLQELAHGDAITLPNLVERWREKEEDVKAFLSNQPTKIRETANTLFALAEKPCIIRKDGEKNTAMDYKDFLPKDFYPVIIFDASGRVRKTYKFWNECRKDLVLLKTAPKSYKNLSIHVWETGGGKTSFGREGNSFYTLIEGICDLINSKPKENFLVVTHKPDDWEKGGVPDIANLIEKGVKDPSRVKYLTWGNEKASNDYRDVPNVILAGTLFLPDHVLEVRARASMGLRYNDKLSKEDLRETELGEHMNIVLQAACRGSCRKSVDGDCAPMNLYVIASKASGIPKSLAEIFPGAEEYQQWNPKVREATGKAFDALSFIQGEVKGGKYTVMFKDVMAAIEIKDSGNFSKNIRKHPEFAKAIERMGLYEASTKGGIRFDCFKSIKPDPFAPF